jgi:hypothetical protein
MEGPNSSYSSFEIHIDWKVDQEARMDYRLIQQIPFRVWKRNATFNFLTKLYGWRELPLPVDAKTALQNQARRLNEAMVQNGARLIQLCIEILIGGSQIMWASSSDCVFAVMETTNRVLRASGLNPFKPSLSMPACTGK